MLVTEMITQIDAHGLGDLAEAVKLQAINDAQDDFCSRHPWPFLETAANISTVSGNWNLTLPVDFMTVISVYNVTTRMPLKYLRYETVHAQSGAEIASVAQDSPYSFHFAGSELRLFPTPAAVETIRLLYLKTPATIDDTADTLTVPTRFHRIILMGALSYLYMINDDDGLSDRFQRRYEDRIVQALNNAFVRQYSDPDTVSVITGDSYIID
jgi:hypothetical protein